MTVVDEIRKRAQASPAHAALVVDTKEGDRRISYGELLISMEAHAERLHASGLAPGERCGLLASQGSGFVEAALGILAAGGFLVPIPDDYGDDTCKEFAGRAHLHHLVREQTGFACERLSAPEPVDGNGERTFRALDPAYLRFSSGTTSARKGVTLGHAAIESRLAAANRALAIGPDDRILWLLPMAHHFVVSILLYLRSGATILLPSGSLARPVLELANREAATIFYASPYHLNLLAKDASDLGLAALRLAISTAEGIREDVALRFAARFGHPVVQALGIIEVGIPVWNRASAATKPTALGRPLPDYEVWLRGEDGKPVGRGAPDATGEICIRGPGLFDAYLEPWTLARDVLEPDGFRTGDQGWFDADGDLHLAGRRANRINMAGMKFFSEEVEAVLDAHPAVRRSRVYAREHPHLGEIPVAEIVLADPSCEVAIATLAAHCRSRLPSYKVPREFRIVDELPLTVTGKLSRRC